MDDDHTYNLETGRSVTGILSYFNGTIKSRYSKRKHIVETSTYGTELIAARIIVEMIIEYRYKLRMLGVPIIGMSSLYGDNIVVVTNVSIPGRNIKKKYHTCVYHLIREVSVAGTVSFIYKQSKQNQADSLTKAFTICTLQSHERAHLQQGLGLTEMNQGEY